MRLKILTTTFLVFGLLLLLAWPMIVGAPPPSTAPPKILARYGLRMLLYFAITSLSFILTGLFAWLTLRQTRDQYTQQAKENLKELIEGTLKDHEQQ